MLAQRLAQARRRARRSQAEAAAAAAVPRTAISDIERGCRAVGALELAALARCYEGREEHR